MKKDLHIPEVEDVHIVAVKEAIPENEYNEWNIYIVNYKNEDLDLVIIVSHGFSESAKTSTLRKTIKHLPHKSFAKLEIIQDYLFEFTNQYKVSFFIGHKLYDKTFTFKPNTITDHNLSDVPLISQKGILAE
jgi:hypothetical protein